MPVRYSLLNGSSPRRCGFFQKFVQNLLGELRYQTCELFLAKPAPERMRSRGPLLVAAAFRKKDEYGNSKLKGDKPTGVYSLTDLKLEPLRQIIASGENAQVLWERIKTL